MKFEYRRRRGSVSPLFDEPGPRARRRIWLATIITAALLIILMIMAVNLFASNGQLDADMWVEFTQWPYQLFLLKGLGKTLLAAFGAGGIAIPLGALLAIGRMSTLRFVHWFSVVIIEAFRSMPLLLLIYIFFIALPKYQINPSLYWKLVIPIGLCSAAVTAEVFRAGVIALPSGQMEAALSVGMTRFQAMRYIVFPQAIRLVIPGLLAQVVVVLKDTTLGYAVSYSELQQSAKTLVADTQHLIQTYLVVVVIYIGINFVISKVATTWSRRAMSKYARAGATTAASSSIA